jgi:hypothetical protein
MLEELYSRISAACCYITVFLDNEKISEGSGFAFTPNGQVITAAHVVTGRFPIQLKDYTDPSQRIYCKFPGLPIAEYVVCLCGMTINVPGFRAPVQFDLAVLSPKQPHPTDVQWIPVPAESPRLGQRVFLAGYSEELRVPFDADRLLLPETDGAAAFKAAMDGGYMADMTGPLIKQGHVGNLRRIVTEIVGAGTLECDVMYIDNAMHQGASGGPVFNEQGEAVGVVSQRAVTSVEYGTDGRANVPSGCTVAISLTPLRFFPAEPGPSH